MFWDWIFKLQRAFSTQVLTERGSVYALQACFLEAHGSRESRGIVLEGFLRNMNGSKWFLCGFDSAFLWVRDRKLLLDVFSASGVFMADVEEQSIYNPEFKDLS